MPFYFFPTFSLSEGREKINLTIFDLQEHFTPFQPVVNSFRKEYAKSFSASFISCFPQYLLQRTPCLKNGAGEAISGRDFPFAQGI
jgi:hypothetical protein